MPNVTAGLAEITVNQEMEGIACDSIFYYWNGTNTPLIDLASIANAFDAKVFPDWAGLCNVALTFDLITVRDVFGVIPDHTRIPSSIVGTRTGDASPTFNGMRFDYLGTTKETRRGYKRLAGLGENTAGGNFVTAAQKILMDDFALLLDDSLTVLAETFQPVIYGQPTPTQPTRQVVNLVASVLARSRVTSQTTRKA